MILLVIDIQKGITDDGLYNFGGFLSRCKKLIDTARGRDIEVIYFQHDDGPGSGFSSGDKNFEIADQVAPMKGEKVFVKTINSCFGNEEFRKYMEAQEDKCLMLIGLQTNYCIDATIRSAFERGYRVIVPEGANSTFDNEYMDAETTYRYYNEEIWPGRFADCVSLDDALAMME